MNYPRNIVLNFKQEKAYSERKILSLKILMSEFENFKSEDSYDKNTEHI